MPHSDVPQLALRPATAADHRFLKGLYASTREPELGLTDWTGEQKQQFIDMQFTAQLNHYQEHFPGAAHQIILLEDRPIGRLYVDRRQAEIRLLDITILPDFRNRGLGSRLVKELIREAEALGCPLTLVVWSENHAALRFYARLGFKDVDTELMYILMEWNPRSTT